MKTITKNEWARQAGAFAQLRAGESVEVHEHAGKLILSRPQKPRLTARQMEAELDQLADQCPPLDAQAVLNDLRS